MRVGTIIFMQHAVAGVDDARFVREEVDLAVRAEEFGFEFVGFPEHHFEDYSMAVDNVQLLSYVAARTSRIELFTAVVVLPWHDPVRVAERIILLDHLSQGRVMFGIGRGLAPREYAAFGIDQNEARGRFDELGPLIMRALESGFIEGDGPFYPRERLELRPRPLKSFKDRFYSVANSPSSAEAAARAGGRLTMFVAEHAEDLLPNLELYRTTWRQCWESEPPPPLLSDFTFCTRDPKLAERARNEWFPKSWDLLVDHYDIQRVDFSKIKGYETHAERKERPAYADTQVWGEPQLIVEAWKKRLELLGDATAAFVFRWGGMPIEAAQASIQLFVDEALPELKKLQAPSPAIA